MNVFFVSNSTCYFFTDELFGLLSAAGHDDATLALVYYGGCSVRQHCEWLRESASNYEFRVIDKNGLHTSPNRSLISALGEKDWDVISFDNNALTFAAGEMQAALDITEPYFGELLSKLQKQFPQARYLWHEAWANEIGYNGSFELKTKEHRDRVFTAKHELMKHMMKHYGIEGVPTGDAWEKVRDLPLFTTPFGPFEGVERFTLNSRVHEGAFFDDLSHDGDIGGGQYLNACVWFEILTGESCVGNPFRPTYEFEGQNVRLTEEKIGILQNAAHEAVAEYRAFCADLLSKE